MPIRHTAGGKGTSPGCSSVGRAWGLQSQGRGFNPSHSDQAPHRPDGDCAYLALVHPNLQGSGCEPGIATRVSFHPPSWKADRIPLVRPVGNDNIMPYGVVPIVLSTYKPNLSRPRNPLLVPQQREVETLNPEGPGSRYEAGDWVLCFIT